MSCSYEGCPRAAARRGFCVGHATQIGRGRPLAPLRARRTKDGLGVRALIPRPELHGTMLVPLPRGYFAIIDEADAGAVGRYNWSTHTGKTSRTMYAATTVEGRLTLLHRFLWELWGLPPAPEVDHENTNGLDCRRLNLRPATTAENLRNVGKRVTNRSGFKGVSWHRQRGKWRATIRGQDRCLHLGLFDDPAAAAIAYAEAAARFHGRFARTA